MLLNENHEMIPLIINSLQEDLNSRAPKAGISSLQRSWEGKLTKTGNLRRVEHL